MLEVVRAAPVCSFVTVMVTLGITAPELSCRVPLISPVIICARAGADTISKTNGAHNIHRQREFVVVIGQHSFSRVASTSPPLTRPAQGDTRNSLQTPPSSSDSL